MPNNQLNNVLFLQKCILMNSDGKILALKRVPADDVRGNAWDLPGGTYESGEDVIDSIKREVMEEVNLKIIDPQPIYLASGLNNSSAFMDSDVVFAVTHTCSKWEGELKISDEHSEYRWVTPEEFMSLDFGDDGGFFVSSMSSFIDRFDSSNH